MNYIDIIVLIPLLWFAYKGFNAGFVRELISVLAILAGAYSIRYSDVVAEWINNDKISQEDYYIITFILAVILVTILGRIAEKIIKLVIPDLLNNIAGALFGALKVGLFFSVILFFINTIGFSETLISEETKEKSLTYPYIEKIVPTVANIHDEWISDENAL